MLVLKQLNYYAYDHNIHVASKIILLFFNDDRLNDFKYILILLYVRSRLLVVIKIIIILVADTIVLKTTLILKKLISLT